MRRISSVFLSGPDVFFPEAPDLFARKYALCEAAGFTPLSAYEAELVEADQQFKTRARGRLNDFVSSARTVVLATHDNEIVRATCNKVLVLDHGRVQSFGLVEDTALPAAA